MCPIMKSQMALVIPSTHGGPRRGAGRKGGGVGHRVRPYHDRRCPVHVTLKLRDDVPSLRRRDTFAVVEAAIGRASREDFAVVAFSAQSNHIHLIVEAKNRTALSRGMQGLAIRVARGVNR